MILKTYKEVKTHSSEESEDKVVEGERDKYDNDEQVCYFLMGRAPGMGDRVGWFGGRWGVTLYFLSIVKFSCAG